MESYPPNTHKKINASSSSSYFSSLFLSFFLLATEEMPLLKSCVDLPLRHVRLILKPTLSVQYRKTNFVKMGCYNTSP